MDGFFRVHETNIIKCLWRTVIELECYKYIVLTLSSCIEVLLELDVRQYRIHLACCVCSCKRAERAPSQFHFGCFVHFLSRVFGLMSAIYWREHGIISDLELPW